MIQWLNWFLFFGVLLKEYLDYIWWDYHDEMVKLGIREDKGKKINDKCFTWEEPDLMNYFVTYFLVIEPEICKF